MTPDERKLLQANVEALWAAGIRTAPCQLWEVLQLAKYADAAERDAAGKEWLIADTLASYHAERERRERAEADAARLRGYLRGLPELVVQDVCELPDYTSPEDDPDLVMCMATELMGILESRVQSVLAAALAAQPGEG